ncbi:DUF58 domain-containing protein [Parvularcula dongshanensis]|uniref:Uncharacterized protein (DUF58 family) n=1 Tax=Parvularcula dongshanensis TaxID=1173995 RepID=A0A840I2E4_9PROT|nr:DUF58 domain-containing protein [Parvularcula dongshanensis]MBB4658999.1 uncharacterized protein (DUF58 family) [Parvularcula dongshanensis]
MPTPTPRAVVLAALGLPAALLVGALAPGAWVWGLLFEVAVLALIGADALLARWPGRVALTYALPGGMEVGRAAPARIEARGLPLRAEARLEVSDPLAVSGGAREGEAVSFDVTPLRRGTGRFDALWLRWPGPMGLVRWQKRARLGQEVRITPDIGTVREEALRIFSRMALGETVQRQRGQGSEFEALREYQTGMDPRAIDWKHTARHRTLLAREYRTEQNQNVVLALDAGRLMSEPIAPGRLSRLDVGVTAALLCAYVALKRGDRAALFAYDAQPQVSTGLVSGARGFPALQNAASGIAYSSRETNHTLGLSALAGKLDRRSLVVVMTEFADPTMAELMIETVGRLTRDHLVLFVAFRDEELEAIAAAEPQEVEDVSRAVVASDLLRERELVLTRLRRLGAEVLEADAETFGPAVASRVVAIRERGLL